ncbi:MAG: hypothetical protein KH321_00530 [Clostridium sp.]|nr:hypothetical protein [Clostridium sp.]
MSQLSSILHLTTGSKAGNYKMMKIHNTNGFYKITDTPKKQNKQQSTSPETQSPDSNFELRSQFNDHLISFGARVDKGLDRFYLTNKDRMPHPVRRYIENLDDKTRLTPLEAQRRAFSKLENAQNVQDIQKAFDGEKLFENLIEPEQSRATRGMLASYKENKELLELSGQGALKNNENLTVYLVKKVFLEAKTIDEINKDLENDLDPDFKADFKFKNPNSPYVYGSTLKALGIQMPEFEYQQSLRYTREGYADIVGDKISQGQRAFWDSLDDRERTERAKKSVEKMENWWNSLTRNQKLDMIADQLTELDMLKMFKKEQRAQQKLNLAKQEPQDAPTEPRKHSKVGSNKLSQDELFLKWAANNLKIFQENLSEADRDTLHVKSMQRLAFRWANMSQAERTDYISRMKAGSEPLRYTMIDAWNHSSDLIKDLSLHLRSNQIYKPADLLYSTQEFSRFQSEVMTEFWQTHPDYAKQLGENIIKSQEKIQMAISRGTFEELKKQIMRDKNQRVKEIEKFKTTLAPSAPVVDEPQYKKDFKAAYNSHIYGKVKAIPKNFYNDMYDTALEKLPESAIRAWTKNLNGQSLSAEETAVVRKFVTEELPETARYNRALEAAMADTLYEFTKDPSVYEMSNSDVKTAMYHLERGEEPIIMQSHKTGKTFTLNIVKKDKKVDAQRINNLYETYKQDLSNDEIHEIAELYFNETEQKDELEKYINTYGKSALIIFSNKSAYPAEVKEAFYKKFKQNMPEILKNNVICDYDQRNAFEKEAIIKPALYRFEKKIDFIPAAYRNAYLKEMAHNFRNQASISDLKDFEALCCTKRKDAASGSKIAIIAKSQMTTENKLKSLAMEQALADVLYDATGNAEVYALQFEELYDNLEVFSLVKKFPSQERTITSQTNHTMTFKAVKKPDLRSLSKLYNEYLSEIVQWVNEEVKQTGTADPEDLLYILNPDEQEPLKDINTARRMSIYGFKINKLTIYPNKEL